MYCDAIFYVSYKAVVMCPLQCAYSPDLLKPFEQNLYINMIESITFAYSIGIVSVNMDKTIPPSCLVWKFHTSRIAVD